MNQNPKLHELLQLHDSHQDPAALTVSVGDGFLYHHNPVFRAIRDRFKKFGYQFTTEDFCHYAVLPYVSLGAILAAKKVPYFDNISILREIENKHPQRFRCDDILKVKPNYVFHESSHCVAEEWLKDLNLTDPAMSADRKKAFKLMMAESFANTIESMANAPNVTAESRIFYELNSYILHNRKTHVHLQQAIEALGERAVFRVMYLSYLYSNCLFPEVTTKTYQQVVEAVISDGDLQKKAKDSQPLRRIFNHAFELSMDFRLRTTGFYVAFSGIQTDVIQLLRFDVMEVFRKNDAILKFLDRAEGLFAGPNA